MVFDFNIPSKISEEEKNLRDNKYVKLRKKRKMLEMINQPKIEKPQKEPPKRPIDGTTAKEIAKKLLKSGKIHAIKVDSKEKQESGFKRATSRKISESTAQTPSSSTTYPPPAPYANVDEPAPKAKEFDETANQKPVYESYVSTRDPHALAREETFREKKRDGKANYVNRDSNQQGYTLYIHAEKISEDMLRLGFQRFGEIRNIHIESAKNCGFITYDTIDVANEAIVEMDKSTLNGVRLKVSLARRQPGAASRNKERQKPQQTIQDLSKLPTSDAWSALSSNYVEDREKDAEGNREIVAYDDDDMVYDGF